MHELSLCRSISRIVDRAAGGRRVSEVEIDVGALRQVVPETLAHCWRLVAFGTPLEGAQLKANRLPAVVRCLNCAALTTLVEVPAMICAECGVASVEVVSGDEFLVRSIEVER